MASGIGSGLAGAGFGVLSSILQTNQQMDDIQAMNDEVLRQIDSDSDLLTTQTSQIRQSVKDVTRAVGDKMSERGVRALEQEARLRATSASGGTSGGNTAKVLTGNVFMQEALDNAETLKRGKIAKVDLFKQKVGLQTQYERKVDALISSIGTNTSTAGFISSGLNANMQGFKLGRDLFTTGAGLFDSSTSTADTTGLDESFLGYNVTYNDSVSRDNGF